MKKLFIFLLLSGMFKNIGAQHIFYWKWQFEANTIKITGGIDAGDKATINADAAVVKKRFYTLYKIIDEIEYPLIKTYLKTQDTLSRELVLPFEKQIAQCSLIIIEIDSSLLRLPIEFLNCNNQSLAVAHPLLFTINGFMPSQSNDSLLLQKGFIIRDPTSDPENACKTTLLKYPSSIFKSAYKITPKDFTKKPATDFILISAHGDADSLTLCGGIALNNIENAPASFFKNNNSKLIYIDACQQGINWTYIGALAQTREANFYLGPIISNDSGESSTKTINWFFDYLKSLYNPYIALWKTRIKLYKHYNKKINRMDVINKSFIFRIYKV
jgi:hypothetical protein